MSVPKVIHQTWKTKELPAACIAVRARIQSLNPDYEMKLYDDADIDRFMKDNFDERVYACFASLRVGAARADLWRYCVLYKHGGVYLDIDAGINSSLDSLIRPVDKYILSREGNPNIFLQWMLISAPGHPILGKAIDLCVRNISRRNTNNIIMLTGPNGPYLEAIYTVLGPLFKHIGSGAIDMYRTHDANLNRVCDVEGAPTQCRFYGTDFEGHATFKTGAAAVFHRMQPHWSVDQCRGIFL